MPCAASSCATVSAESQTSSATVTRVAAAATGGPTEHIILALPRRLDSLREARRRACRIANTRRGSSRAVIRSTSELKGPPMPRKILILGASYGALMGAKLALAGHDAQLVCRAQTADLINAE